MKLLISYTLFLCALFFSYGKVKAVNIFIPNGDTFSKIEIPESVKTFNDIFEHLGYNSVTAYWYNDYDKKSYKFVGVVFKLFSKEIICVLTEDEVGSITNSKVNAYLSNFNYSEKYLGYNFESKADKGIKEKLISAKFIEDVFNVGGLDPNGSKVFPKIGYELSFKNGYLSGYKPSDGLNKWAKSFKSSNTKVFYDYWNYSKRFNPSNENAIKKEINTIFDAYARTPLELEGKSVWSHKYAKFHHDGNGLVNFKMLLVAHYDEKIVEDEFRDLNRGRYKLESEYNNDGRKRTTYRLYKVLYTFDEKGNLVDSFATQ